MSEYLVYQANRNIEEGDMKKSLRKDNKIFAKTIYALPALKVRPKLIVFTHMGVYIYNPSDFRVAKNQKLNKRILGVNSNG
ncbi:MAG: hypothetical protein E7K00_14905 [Clostridium perfringens]|nr:hypothetical protein [Clostridium perfringens]